MKIMGGYKRDKQEKSRDKSSAARLAARKTRNNPSQQTSHPYTTFRVGSTMAGDAKKAREARLQRQSDRKRRIAKRATVISFFALAVLVVLVIVMDIVVKQQAKREAERLAAQAVKLEPTVPIIDENAGNNVSSRVKDFVANLESDVINTPLKIDRVILPANMARELRIYLSGRTEFYKMSIDRGSAVQAEDMERMVKYLDENGITPEYVDLRVEGKAYYK